MKNTTIAISAYESDRDSSPVASMAAAMSNALEGLDMAGGGAYMLNCPTEDAWDISYVYSGTALNYKLTSTAGTADDTKDDISITGGTFSNELSNTPDKRKKKWCERHQRFH